MTKNQHFFLFLCFFSKKCRIKRNQKDHFLKGDWIKLCWVKVIFQTNPLAKKKAFKRFGKWLSSQSRSKGIEKMFKKMYNQDFCEKRLVSLNESKKQDWDETTSYGNKKLLNLIDKAKPPEWFLTIMNCHWWSKMMR